MLPKSDLDHEEAVRAVIKAASAQGSIVASTSTVDNATDKQLVMAAATAALSGAHQPIQTPIPTLPSGPSSPTPAAPIPAYTPKASSSTPKPFVSTKQFNPDDIFCLGCCRNLSVDHYTCPTSNRVFKSCNACRQKSRINSKKATKPSAVPTKTTISMEEFGNKLKEMEESQEESNLDVLVRLEGSVEMDQETLKARGAQIAAQVYESTGYWFSHSRTNEETQSKTRLKIYGCSQREDRRAPPAPKTQTRKRNRPSTKAYFPCKGNLTMTFYQNLNHVRVIYGHKRHAKYDNRKCPDHVRAFVKDNLHMAPRQLYETLMENNPSLGITQAQVRYWSHFYKKNSDYDTNSNSSINSSINSNLCSHRRTIAEQAVHGAQVDSKHDSRDGSPSHHSHHQHHHQHPQHHDVHQLILANTSVSGPSLQHHPHSPEMSSGPIAISVPMSTSMDTSNMVQSLAEDAKMLQIPISIPPIVGQEDMVVQQVSAFMKENDQQQQQQQQQQQHQHPQ